MSDRTAGSAGPSGRASRRRLPALLGAIEALGAIARLATLPSSIAEARRRGAIWRADVAEESMLPALRPGDWLLIDPTPRTWPRRGSVVVVREPETGILAVKRIAARGGDRVRIREGYLHLADDEAWLLGDNAARSVDSRRYGPITADQLVGRVWLRYWPPRRIGRPRNPG